MADNDSPQPKTHIFVGSSSLSSATWSPEKNSTTGSLEITFNRGQTYTYDNVPMDVFDALVSAPSAGQYFHSQIKDRY